MKLKDTLNEAKPKFEVKYSTSRRGKIQVAKFMTISAAKKFLEDIEKTGAKGIISVNGKPLKLAKYRYMDFGEASPGRRSKGRARQADARMKSWAKRWMADVSDEVEKLNPKMAGRIDWDTAHVLSRKNMKPAEAAKRLVKLGPVKEA